MSCFTIILVSCSSFCDAQSLGSGPSDLTSTQDVTNSTNSTWHIQGLHSTQTSTVSRSRGIGDFVAQGLGLVTSRSTPTSPSTLAVSTSQNNAGISFSTSSASASNDSYTYSPHDTLSSVSRLLLAANHTSIGTAIDGHHNMSTAIPLVTASASRNTSAPMDLNATSC